VTVLIPAHNAGAFLREAVDSILAQTFTDFECLVIDDGSTDGAVEALRAIPDPRLRIERNPRNLGLIATLNRGLELARAPLLARMDADDVALPQRLERQVAAFAADPSLAIVGTWAQFVDEAGARGSVFPKPVGHDDIVARSLLGCPFVHPSVMFRVAPVVAVGGYPADAPHAEDYALWLKLVLKHRCANLPEVLLLYRLHGGQVSQKRLFAQWEQSWRLRRLARIEFARAGLVTPREELPWPGLWERLRGQTGTLGANYAALAWCYRHLGQRRRAIAIAATGLRVAPLCGRLWRVMWPHRLRPAYWLQRLGVARGR
jgi:glycosyltransferase involved in cell wall biosynthesis